MIYVIMQYWDFLLLAVALGIVVGWWAQTGRGSAGRPKRQGPGQGA